MLPNVTRCYPMLPYKASSSPGWSPKTRITTWGGAKRASKRSKNAPLRPPESRQYKASSSPERPPKTRITTWGGAKRASKRSKNAPCDPPNRVSTRQVALRSDPQKRESERSRGRIGRFFGVKVVPRSKKSQWKVMMKSQSNKVISESNLQKVIKVIFKK